jgi:disulfide bond formation protein DsbB
MRFGFTLRQSALAIALAAAATVGGALVFEQVGGYIPCKLCLIQRNPYYAAIPLALVAAVLPRRWTRAGLWLLALVFVVSAGLGAYHAGVEWGLWAGPSDCGGAAAPGAGSMGDFLNQLQTTRVVSCTEAAWRFLGLSLAGWNVVVSLGLVLFAARAAAERRTVKRPAAGRPYGSSSLSQ